MQDVHVHMFPLLVHITQTLYIQIAQVKPYKMSIQTFIAKVNKINDQLEQFPPRDDGTPQVKLADDKLMEILENAMLKLWQ
eukprot:4712335-Ditylum_brightwellii.AAC.1